MIRIQGLHKYFNKGRQNEIHVINGVDLELPERGMVAIFGKSGCGKTTLLNVIGGLDGFAEGKLTIEGNDVRQNTDDIRNRYIGYIFQNYNLNKGESCFDNVADALRLCGMVDGEEIKARVDAALRNVGMDKYSKRTPDTLSGGQQQRIAIARAIVKNPRIILADEPTGNLDEANTVMIMDLLKAISRDHLVLLVTHEANLVGHYCDMVIELSDGKVVNTKSNSSANGFAARDKNDVFLGELEKTDLRDGNAEIEYYGDAPESPVKIRIVNVGGKIYVEVGTERVQIIDEFSEVKLREGVYEEKARQAEIESNIDMSLLTPIESTHCGRLFSFRSSVKSGYEVNFKGSKRKKKTLRNCMCLLAAVVVLMSAVFGGVFGDIIDARKAYNHNAFYVYTDDAQTSKLLTEAIGDDDSGIDYIRLSGEYPSGDRTVSFRAGNFETFVMSEYESNFFTNAVYLDETLAEELPLVEGKRELGVNEILISTKVADALLEKSALGYITEYKDLIGLISSSFSLEGKSARVAGIVKSDESAVYLSKLGMAKYVNSYLQLSSTALASDKGMKLEPGETVLAIRNYNNGTDYPDAGEKIKIQGVELTVKDAMVMYYSYEDYLTAKGIKKSDETTYFIDLMKTAHPDLEIGNEEYDKAFSKLYDEKYFEYYDYYYSELGNYVRNNAMIDNSSDLYVWMYAEKGVEEAKYATVPPIVFMGERFKAVNGRYPSLSEFEAISGTLPEFWEYISAQYPSYENEFYNKGYYSSYFENTYFISDSDYILMSKQLGETHPTAMPYMDYEKDAIAYSEDVVVDSYISNTLCYTVIHSIDPEKTAAWLEARFSDASPYDYWPSILTPEGVFNEIIREKTAAIIAGLVTMAVILVLMSVCMFFIMRSSLMSRIKEVGIYRAIGVSKKNLVFRFFIESIVLSVMTVMVGYLISSGFLFACLGISSLVSEIFYYPLWLAVADFVILAVLSLFCGTLPILSLLRKTPSEILAKYDI